MKPLSAFALDPARLDDPTVLTWALARASEELELELPPQDAHVCALFDASTLERLLTVHAPPLRALLFDSLASERFRPLLNVLASLFLHGDPSELSHIARVYAKLDPDGAVGVFAEALNTEDAGRRRNPDALFALGAGLCDLAPERGAELVGPYINAVQVAGLATELELPAVLAVKHGRSDARHLVQQMLRSDAPLMRDCFYELISTDRMMDTIELHRVQKRSFTAAATAFVAGAPLAEIDRAVAGAPGPLPAPGTKAGAARALPYLDAASGDLYIAAVLDGHLARSLDASGFTATQALEHLAVDLMHHPHRTALVARLRELPITDVRAAFMSFDPSIRERVAGHHLAWAAGQLEEPALIPFLLALQDDGAAAGTAEEAMDAVARIGSPAVPSLVERLAPGPSGPRAWAAGALAMIGGPAAVDALETLVVSEGVAAPGWDRWLAWLPHERLYSVLVRHLSGAREAPETLFIVGHLLGGGMPEERAPERARERPATANQTGRNDPCPCGSGKKYKKCCLGGKGA